MTTFTVTTTADSLDSNDGKLSLREALVAANRTAAADSIAFAPYLEGKTLLLTRGQLEITASVTINGDPDRDNIGVTIDQRTDQSGESLSARVFAIGGQGTISTLVGLTIAGGSTYLEDSDPLWGGSSGAGIKVIGDADLNLVRCSIQRNNADTGGEGLGASAGGGIDFAYGRLTISQSSIIDNFAAYGGGIEARGSVTIDSSTIAGNYGGVNADRLSISNSTLTDNHTGSYGIGGGLNALALTISNTLVVGNTNVYATSDITAGQIVSNGRNVVGQLTGAMPNDIVGAEVASIFASTSDGGGGALTLVNGAWVVPLLNDSLNPALAAADPATAGGSDQRGATRPSPHGSLPDIGAFELTQTVKVSHTPSAGSDMLKGTPSADTIYGLAGDDAIYALGGNDVVAGGKGHDALFGGRGRDRIEGGNGNDFLDGGRGDDRLDGDSGIDTASYVDAERGVRVDLARSGAQVTGIGADTLLHIENLVGSNFDDHLRGDGGANRIDGLSGYDVIEGRGGDDILISKHGARLDGGAGDDVLRGDALLIGGPGDDRLYGGDFGATASYATATSAVAVNLAFKGAQQTGGAGRDTLSSVINLEGSRFSDILRGNIFDNAIDGGAGDDIIYGDAANGGRIGDFLTGGAGRDHFVYERANQSTGTLPDTIGDFEGAGKPGGDLIDLSGLVPGELVFRGTAAFTGVNQVRVTSEFGTVVEINLIGTKAPEMAIEVRGNDVAPSQWTAADFIL